MNPGFVDRTSLIPDLCAKACFTFGYDYGAIEAGEYCFCNSEIKTILSSDENCQELTCPGNSELYCGSKNHLVVYSVDGVLVRFYF